MDIAPLGLRFAALITTVVLAMVLVTGVWLLTARAVVFAVGSIFGLVLVH